MSVGADGRDDQDGDEEERRRPRVVLSRPAHEDIGRVYAYYVDDDYEHAERAVRAIYRACEGLADFPLMGKIGKMEDTRERLMTRYPYRLVYRIAGDTLVVLRVLHKRQQWPPTADDDDTP